jgi:hypothetical protein
MAMILKQSEHFIECHLSQVTNIKKNIFDILIKYMKDPVSLGTEVQGPLKFKECISEKNIAVSVSGIYNETHLKLYIVTWHHEDDENMEETKKWESMATEIKNEIICMANCFNASLP